MLNKLFSVTFVFAATISSALAKPPVNDVMVKSEQLDLPGRTLGGKSELMTNSQFSNSIVGEAEVRIPKIATEKDFGNNSVTRVFLDKQDFVDCKTRKSSGWMSKLQSAAVTIVSTLVDTVVWAFKSFLRLAK